MNAEEYRRAVDAVPFRSDFVPRTLSLLETHRKESSSMKHVSFKTALAAAALMAALAITASAALFLLSPSQVAQEAGNPALAAAFESDAAVSVNETQTVGDYQVTLLGLLPGASLDQVKGLTDPVQDASTYAVLAFSRTDGAPIEDNVPELTVTPVVEGYAPWQVNAWTLDGSVCSFAQDGTLYYLFACDSVEPFADHTVSLAVYPGTHVTPSNQIFSFGADGSIAYQPGQDGVLFALPLDPAKADPAAVAEFLEPWQTQDPVELPEDGEVSPDDVQFTWENGDGEVVIVPAEQPAP